MAATPSDIAKFTTDGIVITASSAEVDAAHEDASDQRGEVIEMFFANEADGQLMLDERLAILARLKPLHVGVEVEEGSRQYAEIALVPVVPSFVVSDPSEEVSVVARLRALSYNSETGRMSLEMIE